MAWELFAGADLRPLAGLWQRAETAGPASIFQSFAFARRWSAAFARRAEPRIWVHAAPPFVIPLARGQDGLTALGEGLFDYVDPLGDPGMGAEAARWVRQTERETPRATGVRVRSPYLDFWRGVGGDLELFAAAPRREASLELSGEHARLAGRWRRAQQAGARVEAVTGPEARRQLLDWILEQKTRALAARRQDNVLGAEAVTWLRAMVEYEPGLSELWGLRRGERWLSGLLCWRALAVRYGYTICYEQDAAPLSPGVLLLFAVLQRTMDEGLAFDFLTGEQPYKLRFATACEPLLRLRAHGAR